VNKSETADQPGTKDCAEESPAWEGPLDGIAHQLQL
jgi:hypothetical protein